MGLEHLVWILANMRTEFRVNGPWTHDGEANVMRAKLFGNGITQSIQSPFRSCIGRAVGQRILASKRRNVDDVAFSGANHHGRKGANSVKNSAQVRIQDLFPSLRCHFMEGPGKGADSGIVHENIKVVK